MQCKICEKENEKTFNAKILKKYDISYYHCHRCGFLQTEEPYWLDEAYKSPINISDTGYMQRNISFCKKVSIFLFLFFDKRSSYLDYAAGYGVFVRMMRDVGFDFYWDDKYTENLFCRGFENNSSQYDAITTFESFEHFDDPIKEIESMLLQSRNIIFSTELLPDKVPYPNDWWYYGLTHGQHISFYSHKTLEFIAKKYNLNYSSIGSLHFFTQKKIPYCKLQVIRGGSKVGLYKLIQIKLKSKTWADYLFISNS